MNNVTAKPNLPKTGIEKIKEMVDENLEHLAGRAYLLEAFRQVLKEHSDLQNTIILKHVHKGQNAYLIERLEFEVGRGGSFDMVTVNRSTLRLAIDTLKRMEGK